MDLIRKNVAERTYYAVLEGPNHRTQALARRMEKRGEICVNWDEAKVSRSGVARVPYIRMRSIEEVHSARVRRAVGWWLIGLSWLGALLAAVWSLRYMVGGGALFAGSVWYLITRRRHRGACAGLHCSGCKS